MQRNKAKQIDQEMLHKNLSDILWLLDRLGLHQPQYTTYASVEELIYRMVYVVGLEFPTTIHKEYRPRSER